jgi:hypothetical protein
MNILRSKVTVALALAGLLAMSGIAYAAPTESEDTSFNYAYDAAFHVLVWSISDVPDACEFGDSTIVTYEVGDGINATSESTCSLSAGDVTGPNGQINHGMFMKLFNSLFEGQARGCVNRILAQSDLGKGDQQIKVSDVDPLFVPVATGDMSDFSFENALTTCTHGKQDGTHGKSGESHGKSGESHGKSGEAPGRSK